jgi:CRP/FNR family transcriptional regulator
MVDVWFRYAEWRNYINGTFSKQFLELIAVINLIAFSNMDRQVLHYLQERAKATNVNIINITHQEITDEFHTHREAISRLFRTMEQKNLVKLGRNTIELSQLWNICS